MILLHDILRSQVVKPHETVIKCFQHKRISAEITFSDCHCFHWIKSWIVILRLNKNNLTEIWDRTIENLYSRNYLNIIFIKKNVKFCITLWRTIIIVIVIINSKQNWRNTSLSRLNHRRCYLTWMFILDMDTCPLSRRTIRPGCWFQYEKTPARRCHVIPSRTANKSLETSLTHRAGWPLTAQDDTVSLLVKETILPTNAPGQVNYDNDDDISSWCGWWWLSIASLLF